MSGKGLGFFEKRKLDKIVQSLPDPRYIEGKEKEEEAKKKYLKAADECGVNLLIRIAEAMDTLPDDWRDRRGSLQRLSILGLSKLISPNDLSPLLDRLKDMHDDISVGALVNIGGENVKREMLKFLTSESYRLNVIACDVLAEIGDQTMGADIAKLTNNPRTQYRAICALRKLKCVEQVDILVACLNPAIADSIVIGEAAKALKEIGDSRVVDGILAVANNFPSKFSASVESTSFSTWIKTWDLMIAVLDVLSVYDDPRIIQLFDEIGKVQINTNRMVVLQADKITQIRRIVATYLKNDSYEVDPYFIKPGS